jgi:hypothetical protein
LLTVLVIGLALALPLLFHVILDNARQLAGGLREAREITVFLQPAADAAKSEEVPGCRRLSSSRPLRLNLKPETDILDLVTWMSSITCRQFLVPGTVLASPKKVTVYAPEVINAEGATRLFLSALDSVGLTVQESGKFLRIIETSKAKNNSLPLYGFEGKLLSSGAHQESSGVAVPDAKPSADDATP